MKDWKLVEGRKAYYELLDEAIKVKQHIQYLDKMFLCYGQHSCERELRLYEKLFSLYDKALAALELMLFGHKSDIGGVK